MSVLSKVENKILIITSILNAITAFNVLAKAGKKDQKYNSFIALPLRTNKKEKRFHLSYNYRLQF